MREVGEDGFYEMLGFGARDEDGGGDFEGEAVELLLAGDVLDGFVFQAAGDVGFVKGFVGGGEARGWGGRGGSCGGFAGCGVGGARRRGGRSCGGARWWLVVGWRGLRLGVGS